MENAEKKRLPSYEAMGLVQELRTKLPLMEQVAACARRIFNGETVPAADLIFSIFEPHTELLKGGKSRKPVEFGHMVTVGQTAEKFISYYNVEEHRATTKKSETRRCGNIRRRLAHIRTNLPRTRITMVARSIWQNGSAALLCTRLAKRGGVTKMRLSGSMVFFSGCFSSSGPAVKGPFPS